MLNLECGTAGLMSILVRSGRRTRLLEIGIANGYSTIALGVAAEVVASLVGPFDFVFFDADLVGVPSNSRCSSRS
jgi:predicted O-methyltransferase YrrM